MLGGREANWMWVDAQARYIDQAARMRAALDAAAQAAAGEREAAQAALQQAAAAAEAARRESDAERERLQAQNAEAAAAAGAVLAQSAAECERLQARLEDAERRASTQRLAEGQAAAEAEARCAELAALVQRQATCIDELQQQISAAAARASEANPKHLEAQVDSAGRWGSWVMCESMQTSSAVAMRCRWSSAWQAARTRWSASMRRRSRPAKGYTLLSAMR